MDRHVVAASSAASVGSALRLMKEANVPLIPVVLDGMLLGVLTKDDAQQAGDAKTLGRVKLRLLYVTEGDAIGKAAKIMVANVITRLPVVDDDISMRLVGMITSTDVVKTHRKGK